LGESVLRDHVDQHFGNGVQDASSAAEEYLRGHDFAVRWAKANRELIAHRFVAALGAAAECLRDGCHNSITPSPSLAATLSHRMGEGLGVRAWVHRKGAVTSDAQFV